MTFDPKTVARHQAIESGDYEYSFQGGFEAGWDAAMTITMPPMDTLEDWPPPVKRDPAAFERRA